MATANDGPRSSTSASRTQNAPIRLTTAIAVFAAAWLLWSGQYTPLFLTLGAVSVTLVLLVAQRTGFFAPDVYSLHLGPRLPAFWLWLIKEIVVSTLPLVRLVLARRLEIEPTWVTIDARHLPPAVQVTLANTITIIPGTVTVDVDRGMIEVYCLTPAHAAELDGIVRRAEALARD